MERRRRRLKSLKNQQKSSEDQELRLKSALFSDRCAETTTSEVQSKINGNQWKSKFLLQSARESAQERGSGAELAHLKKTTTSGISRESPNINAALKKERCDDPILHILRHPDR